jgi:DNA-binding transcriptional regulator YiaG
MTQLMLANNYWTGSAGASFTLPEQSPTPSGDPSLVVIERRIGLVSGALAALGGTACLLAGTTSPHLPLHSSVLRSGMTWTQLTLVREVSTHRSPWTAALSGLTAVSTAGPNVIATPAKTSASQVQWLHAESGLTWDQLARVMGVSRRAVHSWAAGHRLAASNAERVAAVYRLVQSLSGDNAGERRSQLLVGRDSLPSTFESLCRDVTGDRSDIGGVSLAERLGVADE